MKSSRTIHLHRTFHKALKSILSSIKNVPLFAEAIVALQLTYTVALLPFKYFYDVIQIILLNSNYTYKVNCSVFSSVLKHVFW